VRWPHLDDAIGGLARFVRGGALDPATNRDWHVVFDHGTVVRVQDPPAALGVVTEAALGCAVERARRVLDANRPAAEVRTAIATGVESEAWGMLWHVFWPESDPTGRTYNLVFARDGHPATENASALRGEDLCRQTPAAVLTPALALWRLS
jgi:hypothetical protein